MIDHTTTTDADVRGLIRRGRIALGGNKPLKIYGLLNCKSGMRMKRTNRVFFQNETEAVNAGFRACGNCMRKHLPGNPERRAKNHS